MRERSVNKTELTRAIEHRTEWSRRESEDALAAVLAVIGDAVAEGERVTIAGFGTFEKRERKARNARNPQTGGTVKVKKTSVPAFKPSAKFKAYVASSKRDQAAFRKQRDD